MEEEPVIGVTTGSGFTNTALLVDVAEQPYPLVTVTLKLPAVAVFIV